MIRIRIWDRWEEVFDDFKKTYGKAVGIISRKAKRANLLAVTTMPPSAGPAHPSPERSYTLAIGPEELCR